MYVVTFYSYKGGVGRTLALVNIAAMLAESGRKVLAVDFDLEAPSLPSFDIFQNARNSQGLVDYVSSYRNTGIAPNCEEFIVECDVKNNPIWVMPAGRHSDGSYTEDLNSIDWSVLYEKQDGYLFFEDMKQQWAQYKGHGFDYVLIDSRTGHTDVGGICTRHLPDAVSIMFLPNDSNITGLTPIVKSIRDENQDRHSKIDLHITPTNVPDLDDEKGILAELLHDASEKLNKSQEFSTTIHHYQSLDILSKSPFSIARPNSKLSRELDELRLKIVGRNLADREGALYTLSLVPSELDTARQQGNVEKRERLHEQTRNILFLHPNDGEVAFLAAQAFDALGDQSEEIEALSIAIDCGHEIDRARLIRGVKSLSSSDSTRDSLADLVAVLRSKTATVFELIPAIQVLKEFSDEWLAAVAVALDRPDEQFAILLSVVSNLMLWREATPLCAQRLLELSNFSGMPTDQRTQARNYAILCLIASGQFHQAIEYIDKFSTSDPSEYVVENLFNRAMATWAIDGEPPIELLQNIIERAEARNSNLSVNARQCLGLAQIALGAHDEAIEQISIAEQLLKPGETVFSCWTYLNTPSEELTQQLQDMRTLANEGSKVIPPFMQVEENHLD
ncbi:MULTISPECIES: KGGVGR-motif variant AAA ATPase [unclassified Ruegeria]|uniref:KGGVGR-motif variant AAA ATPase n=1 Tax=unclassified Ruegeria TaxID=2625375 RepID=UPI0014919436|nr:MULTISPECIES: AAA family ATPase [unclassified Ruegeria]